MAKGFKSGGRVKGTPNKTTAAARVRIDTEADPLGFLTRVQRGEGIEAGILKDDPDTKPVIVFPTLDQRISAAGKLADKLVPNPKSRTIRITLPAIKTASDVLAALGEVIAAMSRGEITLDEGQHFAAALETHRKAIETADIEARLAALEAERAKKER